MMRIFSYLTIILLVLANSVLWVDFLYTIHITFDAFITGPYFLPIVFLAFFVYMVLLWRPNSTDILLDFNFIIVTILFVPLFLVSFAYIYRLMDLVNANSNFDYMYFSVVTFTTLGYGDLLPKGEARKFAALEALIGFIFVPILIGQFISIARDFRVVSNSRDEFSQRNGPATVSSDAVRRDDIN